jgi:hypothetical protein
VPGHGVTDKHAPIDIHILIYPFLSEYRDSTSWWATCVRTVQDVPMFRSGRCCVRCAVHATCVGCLTASIASRNSISSATPGDREARPADRSRSSPQDYNDSRKHWAFELVGLWTCAARGFCFQCGVKLINKTDVKVYGCEILIRSIFPCHDLWFFTDTEHIDQPSSGHARRMPPGPYAPSFSLSYRTTVPDTKTSLWI